MDREAQAPGMALVSERRTDSLRPIGEILSSQRPRLSAPQKRLFETLDHDTDPGIIYQHSVLCHTGLPYRNPGDERRRWCAQNGFVTLEIEAGRAYDHRVGGFVDVGLPFGPKPRLVLYHLNAEALRTGSPVITLETTLTAFVRRTLGLDAHGRNIQAVREQLTRLAAADFRMGRAERERSVTVNGRILNGLTLWTPQDATHRVLWPTEVKFSQEFFESLTRHAVPLNETAVSRLSHNAMALDIYAWLAQRLHRIEQGKSPCIPWGSLAQQFGSGYSEVRAFRRVFRRTLAQVKVVYPDAHFELHDEGMRLKHSRPPIARRFLPCGAVPLSNSR
jgi:Plasmid encoded RepA protein